VLLNTVPGLNLSDARNGGSGEDEGNRFAACASGVFKGVYYLSIEKFDHRERRNIIRPVVALLDLIPPCHVRASKANILSFFSIFCPSNLFSLRLGDAAAMLSVALTSCKHVRASFQEKTGFPITA
jgi:hypothetical protein